MKILFTSTHETSFINEDLTLLRRSFDVRQLLTRGMLAVPGILSGVLNADVTFTWFASVYSFVVVLLARVFGKRSVVIIGGVDAARCPEINYGIWLSWWKAPLVGFAMRKAHKLLVVDQFLRRQVIELANYEGENIECIPTGYDSGVWVPGGEGKEKRVLTVAACGEPSRMNMKGIPFLLGVARRMPDTPFTIIGPTGEVENWIRAEALPNVEVISFLPRIQLLKYYQKARVYCQPSYFDGLPNSVCEAMLCECIPVGTCVGGIPTAVGDTGFLVRHGDIDGLTGALSDALALPDIAGRKARLRIMENFTLERRESELKRVLLELAG